MDADVKQLKESMEKYCAYAMDHLFGVEQWPPIQGLAEHEEALALSPAAQAAAYHSSLLEAHFVFPNIGQEERTALAKFRWVNHQFNVWLRVKDLEQKLESCRDELERLCCEGERHLYDEHPASVVRLAAAIRRAGPTGRRIPWSRIMKF